MAKPIANAGSSPSPYTYAGNPTVVILDGSGTPGTGGSSITAYQWSILDQPDAVTVDDFTIYNPTVANLPTEGTVLLFLVVTDNLGAVSEDDPLQAPDSAFVRFSVKSQTIDIEKPAAGQRNWEPAYSDMVDKVDDFKAAFDAHTIDSHDTFATGAQLTTLTDGSSADGLHTHSAAAFSTLAAVGTAGKVELAEPPLDAGHPKAATFNKVSWSAVFSGSVDVEAGTPSLGQIALYNEYSDVLLTGIGLALRDAGASTGSDWEFKIYEMTTAKYLANSFSGAGVTLLATIPITKPPVANQPMATFSAYAETPTLTVARWLVVRCTVAPDSAGSGLSATISGVVRY